jgi:hypothetical protein
VRRRQELSPRWSQRLAAEGLLDAADLLEPAPFQKLAGRWEALSKNGLGGRRRWRWELDQPDANGSSDPPPVLFLKQYLHTPLREQWDRIGRQSRTRSRAWWEFTVCQRLRQVRIAAPEPIACVEVMTGALEQRSAVLLRRVSGQPLDRAWTELCAARAPLSRGAARHDLAVRLGRFIAAFHSTRMCHRDLYLCHVFAELDPDARSAPRFALIDLARVCRPRWRRMRWLLKDLAQLDASAQRVGVPRSDRLRCLIAYLGLETGAPRLRWYVSRIQRRSQRILRRAARRAADGVSSVGPSSP